MKKIILIISFYILYVNAYSQSWSPNVGTYWYYTELTPSFCSEGYMKFEYFKDSLVGSNNCQMIKRYFVANCQSGSHAEYIDPIFTYINSNVVYLNDVLSSSSVQFQTFDTLFCFNVPIGFQWELQPGTYTSCPTSARTIVTVLDTGHRVIQGVNLKWQKVQYNSLSGSLVNDTIYERFGYLNTNPFNPYNYCSSIADADYYLKFRCYGDHQIIDFKYGHNYNCDYVLGVEELSFSDNFVEVYPIPTDDILNIKTIASGNNLTIEIYNNLGALIMSDPGKQDLEFLDAKHLLSGIYFLKLFEGNRLLATKKILVQH